MVLQEILNVMRLGGLAGDPNFKRQAKEFISNLTSGPPTSGDNGRGTAFGQTGPTTLQEQRKLALAAEANDTTLPFAGL